MGLQVIQDSNGRNTGVYIPYSEWSKLKKQHKDLAVLEQGEKQEVRDNIKKGLEEVKLFKKGKLKTTSAKDFLNDL